jgi:SAM-dependent methyltransferase
MNADPETLALYDRQAASYADRVAEREPSPRLRRFIAALPPGGRALDLGCGPGDAAAAMARAGLEVDALDAAPGMVALARERHGVAARLATFEEVDTTRAYHGVWASFSLLHAPRGDMPAHLARLHAALAPGGLLYLGLKLGSGAWRDSLGRLYTYWGEDEIVGLLDDAGFTLVEREIGRSRGFAGTEADWIVLLARRR